MDVVDDAALLTECGLQCRWAGLDVLELIAEILIDLLEALPMAEVVTAGFADDEAEGCR